MCVSCFQHAFSMCKLWRRICYKPGYYRAFQIFSEVYKHGASICKSSLTDVHNACVNFCMFFQLFVASNSKKRTIMDITKKYQLFLSRLTATMSRQITPHLIKSGFSEVQILKIPEIQGNQGKTYLGKAFENS